MSLKVAFGGKGGVGKTTITALLARLAAADKNNRVLAVDADPVTNLAAALGIDESTPITPIAELTDFIAERTGATPGSMGNFFSLNPKVDDIPDKFSILQDGVRFLALGTVKKGGSGCICPASTVLKALMNHLILYQNDMVFMDMEAGVEHLGRATSAAVDALVIVVNPGSRSRAAAPQIKQLAEDIGIKNIVVLGNRVMNPDDEQLVRQTLPECKMLGSVSELDEIVQADRLGVRPFADIHDAPPVFQQILTELRGL